VLFFCYISCDSFSYIGFKNLIVHEFKRKPINNGSVAVWRIGTTNKFEIIVLTPPLGKGDEINRRIYGLVNSTLTLHPLANGQTKSPHHPIYLLISQTSETAPPTSTTLPKLVEIKT
jgi:hypothetical protein